MEEEWYSLFDFLKEDLIAKQQDTFTSRELLINMIFLLEKFSSELLENELIASHLTSLVKYHNYLGNALEKISSYSSTLSSREDLPVVFTLYPEVAKIDTIMVYQQAYEVAIFQQCISLLEGRDEDTLEQNQQELRTYQQEIDTNIKKINNKVKTYLPKNKKQCIMSVAYYQ